MIYGLIQSKPLTMHQRLKIEYETDYDLLNLYTESEENVTIRGARPKNNCFYGEDGEDDFCWNLSPLE